MLNQRAVSGHFPNNQEDLPVTCEGGPPEALVGWADNLRDRGLGEFALILTRLLQVWGFVGGQILWMLAPFLGDAVVAPIAEAFEDPETMAQLYDYVAREPREATIGGE